jgi:hypothetical protein
MKFIIKILSLFALLFILGGDLFTAQWDLDLHVSHGKSFSHVALHWSGIEGTATYQIFRSENPNKGFVSIGSTGTLSFNDTSCEPGIEYFYKVYALKSDSTSDDSFFSGTQPGYRKIDLSSRYSLDNLLELKDQSVSALSPDDLSNQEKLSPYYISWLRLQFIIFVSRAYFINKTVIILTDFQDFVTNKELDMVSFVDYKEDYSLDFYSQQLFTFYNDINDEKLFETILSNAMAFCVYKGEKKIRDSKGRIKYIPDFEAIGIASQYFKYSKEWPNRTLLFSSKNKDLMNEFKKIQ